jgi:cyanate permease|tara:strand:+ start:644 stop:979 length:336 start_codon:yes stop_codon:yes gene_type:complete
MSIAYAVLIGLGSTYALWIFYLAVMNLKRAKDAGLLSTTAKFLGYPVLIVGYLLDCFVNFTVMTLLLLEIPQETTVTSRLSRHNQGAGWRKAIAAWAEPLLDPYDPSGNHI